MKLEEIIKIFEEEQKKYPFRYIRENIYGAIGMAIATMAIQPGEHLYEKELAEVLNLSRTPVRQALDMLMELKFLTYKNKQGYIVTGLDKNTFLELHRFRKAVEPAMAYLAAENPTDQELDELHRVLKLMENKNIYKDMKEYARVEELFHQQIVSMCKNIYLIQSYQHFRLPLLRARHMMTKVPGKQGEFSNVFTEHFQIYLAIRTKNPTMASHAMQSHLDEPRLFDW